MKFILRLLIALAVITTACDAGQLSATALLIFKDPLTGYSEAFDVACKSYENRFITKFVLPDGRTEQFQNAGIVAILDYPPENLSPELELQATSTLQTTESLLKQFPQFKPKLETLRTKWENALAATKQLQTASAVTQQSTPSADTISFTTTKGRKYENVTVSGTTDTGITVFSNSGVQFIDFELLPKDIQDRYGYDPAKSAARKQKDAVEKAAQIQRDEEAKRLKEEWDPERYNSDEFTDPLGFITVNPSYSETVEFINDRLKDYDSSIGYGKVTEKMIYKTRNGTFVFDPSVLTPDAIFEWEDTDYGVRHCRITLKCRNNVKAIKALWTSHHGLCSTMEIPVGNKIEAQKMANAFAHLIVMFGGKKELF